MPGGGHQFWHERPAWRRAGRLGAGAGLVLGPLLAALGAILAGNDKPRELLWIAMTLLGTALPVLLSRARDRGRQRRLDELEAEATEASARLMVATGVGLTPCVMILADMAKTSSTTEREALLRKAEQAVVNAAANICGPHGQTVRAVYFKATAKTMSQAAFSGTTEPSARTFTNSSDVAGKAAWDAAKTGQANLYEDIRKRAPDGFTRSPTTTYETFVSVGVVHSSKVYGMLNVDAPKSGQLVDTDRMIVSLLARLLAVGNVLVDA